MAMGTDGAITGATDDRGIDNQGAATQQLAAGSLLLDEAEVTVDSRSPTADAGIKRKRLYPSNQLGGITRSRSTRCQSCHRLPFLSRRAGASGRAIAGNIHAPKGRTAHGQNGWIRQARTRDAEQ